MYRKDFCVSVGEDRLKIELSAVLVDNGINIMLTGGESPHIGGVVMALPRNSLTGDGSSSDNWIIPVPGHKDVEAAKPVAERICRETGLITVVVGGIHIDQAQEWELKQILENCKLATEIIIKELRRNDRD